MQVDYLASSLETGKLEVMHLKRFWNKSLLKRDNKLNPNDLTDEWQHDQTLLHMLGVGLEQTLKHVYQTSPSFEQFEDWILETAGEPNPENIARYNKLFVNPERKINSTIPQVLDEEQLSFWDKNGYIIIKNAVPKEDCEETIQVICDFIGIERDDPETWYKPHPSRQGIMIQLFQHPILTKNRQSAVIRSAFEQLWKRTDIWASTDRVGFNPPETSNWKFSGPDLHWDVSLELPIPFGLQGILYLADTAANQGAFTLVPGFQHRIENWINTLPPDSNPRQQNMHALGSIPIVANAGDFIIWHHALPHGSSRNTSAKPRYVHYINYAPLDAEKNKNWK